MHTNPPAAAQLTAFAGKRKVAAGPLHAVAQSLKELVTREPDAQILIFDDASGSQVDLNLHCLLYTSPSPRDLSTSRMPSSA